MSKRLIWIPVLMIALVAALATLLLNGEEATADMRSAVVERGVVEQVVSSTGTLQATRTVDVGTQVSGKITQMLVDYNDRVVKGQLLARIDATILDGEVLAAQAGVDRSRAEVDRAERELERNRQLHEQRVITDSEMEQLEYAHTVAATAHTTAVIGLERARRNLEYTEIRAPMGGVVVERAVDVGQTVAASMSAPTLFRIAEDLSKMEILAQVDESDIAQVSPGQEVRFQVQATGERSFAGTVREVRLQSSSAENVVSYTVVIGIDNADGALLPGMTASVDFVVARADDVLKVANSALRLRPTTAMLESAGAAPPTRSAGAADSATLWTTDAVGGFRRVTVATGLSDGQYTEVSGAGLDEGTEVITGVVAAVTAQQSTSNPFQAQARSSGPGGAF